jgi:hypothetical protein
MCDITPSSALNSVPTGTGNRQRGPAHYSAGPLAVRWTVGEVPLGLPRRSPRPRRQCAIKSLRKSHNSAQLVHVRAPAATMAPLDMYQAPGGVPPSVRTPWSRRRVDLGRAGGSGAPADRRE